MKVESTGMYEPGEIIQPQIENAWIDRAGKMHYVPFYGHYDTAILLNSTSDDLEKAGWIHLSLAWPGYIVVDDRYSPSQSQIDTMFDLLLISQDANSGAGQHMRSAVRMFFELQGEEF